MADSYAPPGVKPTVKMSKSDQGEFITAARKKLDAAYEFERENRREAAMDMAFKAGHQWPESIRKERQAAGRPILTINRLPQFIQQITNDIRQSDSLSRSRPSMTTQTRSWRRSSTGF